MLACVACFAASSLATTFAPCGDALASFAPSFAVALAISRAAFAAVASASFVAFASTLAAWVASFLTNVVVTASDFFALAPSTSLPSCTVYSNVPNGT